MQLLLMIGQPARDPSFADVRASMRFSGLSDVNSWNALPAIRYSPQWSQPMITPSNVLGVRFFACLAHTWLLGQAVETVARPSLVEAYGRWVDTNLSREKKYEAAVRAFGGSVPAQQGARWD